MTALGPQDSQEQAVRRKGSRQLLEHTGPLQVTYTPPRSLILKLFDPSLGVVW